MDAIPLTLAFSFAGGLLIWACKLAVQESLLDRRARRESMLSASEAEKEAFKAHVIECNERALTFARLESKFDSMRVSMDARTAKVDTIFEVVVSTRTRLEDHIKNDEKFQERIEEAIRA